MANRRVNQNVISVMNKIENNRTVIRKASRAFEAYGAKGLLINSSNTFPSIIRNQSTIKNVQRNFQYPQNNTVMFSSGLSEIRKVGLKRTELMGVKRNFDLFNQDIEVMSSGAIALRRYHVNQPTFTFNKERFKLTENNRMLLRSAKTNIWKIQAQRSAIARVTESFKRYDNSQLHSNISFKIIAQNYKINKKVLREYEIKLYDFNEREELKSKLDLLSKIKERSFEYSTIDVFSINDLVDESKFEAGIDENFENQKEIINLLSDLIDKIDRKTSNTDELLNEILDKLPEKESLSRRILNCTLSSVVALVISVTSCFIYDYIKTDDKSTLDNNLLNENTMVYKKQQGYIKAENLRIRTNPWIDADNIVEYVNYDGLVSIVQSKDGWHLIEYSVSEGDENKKIGWVFGKYVKIID